MRSLTSLIVVLIAASVAICVPAEAAKRKALRSWRPAPVLKDCTRLNGRFGYYGNPWCSPAEQRAWDRATSRR